MSLYIIGDVCSLLPLPILNQLPRSQQAPLWRFSFIPFLREAKFRSPFNINLIRIALFTWLIQIERDKICPRTNRKSFVSFSITLSEENYLTGWNERRFQYVWHWGAGEVRLILLKSASNHRNLIVIPLGYWVTCGTSEITLRACALVVRTEPTALHQFTLFPCIKGPY